MKTYLLMLGIGLLAFVSVFVYGIPERTVHAQPTPYALTLQRFDFQPVSIVPPGTNTYSSPVTSRTNFVMAYRNGLFLRPCPTGVLPSPGVCDYWISGLVAVNFPPGMIQPLDLVSLVYYP